MRTASYYKHYQDLSHYEQRSWDLCRELLLLLWKLDIKTTTVVREKHVGDFVGRLMSRE